MPSNKIKQIELNGVTYDIKDPEAVKFGGTGDADEIVVLSNTENEVVASGTTLADLYTRIDAATIIENVDDGEWIINIVNDDGSVDMSNYYSKSKVDELIASVRQDANRQSDWNQTDSSASDYIKNKPTIPTKTSDLSNDSGFVTSSDIPGIETVEVVSYDPQSGWGTPQYTGAEIHQMFTAGKNVKIRGNLILHTEMDGGVVRASYWNGASMFGIFGVDSSKQFVSVTFDRKYLTEENYTPSEKNKLANIASGAEVNVQSDWNESSSSSDAFIKNKPTIPTNVSDLNNDTGFITSSSLPTKVSDLNNDSGFVTATEVASDYYDKSDINSMIEGLHSVSIQIVSSLPVSGSANIIYFVPKTGSTGDVYDEYMWISDAWEHIGSTEVDLTGYATQTWVQNQNYITASDVKYLEVKDSNSTSELAITGQQVYNNYVAGVPMTFGGAPIVYARTTEQAGTDYVEFWFLNHSSSVKGIRMYRVTPNSTEGGWGSVIADFNKMSQGAVAQDNASFVTGGQVYTALGDKIDAPASPSGGNILKYDGTQNEWVAASVIEVQHDSGGYYIEV